MPFEAVPKDRYQFEFVPGNNPEDVAVSLPVTKSTRDGRVAHLICAFGPCALDGEEFQEFYFQIGVLDLDETYEPHITQDRDAARPYLPDEVRDGIMDLVEGALEILLAKLLPERIFFVAKSANLPPKALAKYERIAQALQNNGYSIIDQGSDQVGRRYWKCTK